MRERRGHAACMHAVDMAGNAKGSAANVLGSEHEEVPEGTYKPWIIVACKKNGPKSHRSGGTSIMQGNAPS